ncbi:12625_t:CDS:10 [Gigaspora margarita]|uniref:12625_t:CDS:1 n=1 Tax=Gigaspora margarita TaxID=4874 RepID=A0ABN7V0R0_GIGMA|nr:12625_t:CDS:10 [Gigaspora margarita]
MAASHGVTGPFDVGRCFKPDSRRIFTKEKNLELASSAEREKSIKVDHDKNFIRVIETVALKEFNGDDDWLNEIRFSWNELKTLKDTDLFCNKFKEQTNWKVEAECTIGNIKDKVEKNGGTPAHQHINDLKCDDPLSNGMIDLSSNRFQLSKNDFDLLLEEKAGIRRLTEDVNIVHYHWVEQESDRERIVRDITECLMQLIKSNSFHRVSRGSVNLLVEVVARLIEVATYQLPINRKVEVTRNEYQSVASKNHKAKVKDGARGNRPDFMIQALLGQKWNEIVYAESDGYKEILKKHVKNVLQKNYIAFRINIAGENIIVHGLIQENRVKYYLPIAEAKILLRSESVEEVEEFVHVLMTIRNGLIANLQYLINTIQKKTRKVSERSLSCERLNKKKITKLETKNTKLKQIIKEIANLRIENTKLKQIIKQNQTTNNALQIRTISFSYHTSKDYHTKNPLPTWYVQRKVNGIYYLHSHHRTMPGYHFGL